jgi:hypothetical protein
MLQYTTAWILINVFWNVSYFNELFYESSAQLSIHNEDLKPRNISEPIVQLQYYQWITSEVTLSPDQCILTTIQTTDDDWYYTMTLYPLNSSCNNISAYDILIFSYYNCYWCPPPIIPEIFSRWPATLLTLSNLSFILPIFALAYRSFQIVGHPCLWILEMFDYLFITIISSLYHRCDAPGWNSCFADQQSNMYFMDVLYSFILFTTAVIPHLTLHWFRYLYRMSMHLLTIMLLFHNFDTLDNIVILAVINGTFFIAFNAKQVLYQHRQRWKMNLFTLLFASGFLTAAVVLKFQGVDYSQKFEVTAKQYSIRHSMWHMLAGIASTFLIFFINPLSYKKTSITMTTKKSQSEISTENFKPVSV